MSIQIINLHHDYGGAPVLGGVSFGIESAETLAILGPNGSGKTTLLNAIAGLLAPTSGEVVCDGENILRMDARRRARLVGYVPQSAVSTFDYRVLDYVVTGCAPQIGTFGRPSAAHYEIAMQAIRDMDIEYLVDKSYMRISGGERQQVAIARVLAQRPAYILMDEPTSHLDYGNQIRVLNQIKRLAASGFGVVFTTHNPDQALLIGGKAAILDRSGHMTHGDNQEMMSEALLSRLYGVPLRIANLEDQGRKVCFAPNLGKEDVL